MLESRLSAAQLQFARDPNKPRKFSSTQINLPKQLAASIHSLAAEIPDEYLADDGREGEIHVTCLWGLHGNDAEAVRKLVAGFGPVKLRLGKVSMFPAAEAAKDKKEPFDVIKVDVESPNLHRLHELLKDNLENTQTFPDFKPHITVARVKPGIGKRYVGHPVNEEFTAKNLTFSPKEGEKTEIPLTENKKSSVKLSRLTPAQIEFVASLAE